MIAPNPIDVVEAAYEIDGDARAWLTRVATAVRPLLDGGRGVMAYYYDARLPFEQWFEPPITFGPSVPFEVLKTFAGASQIDTNAAHRLPEPLGLVSQLVLGQPLWSVPTVGDAFRSAGIFDVAGLRTIEPGGRGLAIMGWLPSATPPYDRRAQRLWARVATHIAAARRLRESLQEPDAVLTPNGRVHHAEGDARDKGAREILREAVLRQDKARGRMRREDPARATEAWTALVAGRWSLVDRFERGGRRYVVAQRNEHALPDPRALTPRERAIAHLAALGKSNKLVAYELGLSESTVGTHLAGAMRKLGVKSRVELIRVLAGQAGTR